MDEYFVFADDELFTDAKKFTKKDGIIEIDCTMVSEKSDIDDSLIGGNASAEEASEGADSTEVKGFDVAIQNRLQEMPPYDRKGYLVSTVVFVDESAFTQCWVPLAGFHESIEGRLLSKSSCVLLWKPSC